MNNLPTSKKPIPMKKWIAGAVLILLVAFVVYAITHAIDKYKEEQYLANYGQAAITVGEYTVNYDLYRYFYLNYRDELKAEYTDATGNVQTAALDAEIRSRVAEAVCGLYGAVSLADDYGITPSDGDVRAAALEYVEAIKAYHQQNELDYKEELAANYMTEEIFVFLMSIDSLEDKLFATLVSDGGAIEDNDEELLAILAGDDFVRAKQIFIENDKGETVEDNRAKAEEALAAYLDGEKFDTLIGQYSEDFSMPSGGYYFTYMEMIEPFEEAAFSLEDGEISPVVESADGFHLILRLPKDEAYLQENFEDLKAQYQTSAFYRMIDARGASLRATETAYVRGLSYEEIH